MILIGIVAGQLVAAPATGNLLAEGDFAEGQGAWSKLRVSSSGSPGPGTDEDVTFLAGACQLKRSGSRFAQNYGAINRAALAPPTIGTTYRVTLNFSAPVQPQSGYASFGGASTSLTFSGAAGNATCDILATSTTAYFLIGILAADNGTAVTIDNVMLVAL